MYYCGWAFYVDCHWHYTNTNTNTNLYLHLYKVGRSSVPVYVTGKALCTSETRLIFSLQGLQYIILWMGWPYMSVDTGITQTPTQTKLQTHLCHSVYCHCTSASSRALYPVGGWAFYVNWQWHKHKYGVLSCGWARAFYVTERGPYTSSQQHAGLWKSWSTPSWRPTVRCYLHYWNGFIQQHLIYSLQGLKHIILKTHYPL